jgi:hypothetical protein
LPIERRDPVSGSLAVAEIDGEKIVEEIKLNKVRNTRKQIYFRVKEGISDDFKEKCQAKGLNYNEVLEVLMEKFVGSTT